MTSLIRDIESWLADKERACTVAWDCFAIAVNKWG